MYPVSTVGDVHFVDAAYASVFGHAGTAAQIQLFVDQLDSFEALYSAAGTFGSASNIDLLARGAIYGQMLGVEHESEPVGIEPGGRTFTAPPNQQDFVLHSGDILNVDRGGLVRSTILSGGVVNVNAGGRAVLTHIVGGVENVIGISEDPILSGGVENVVAGGTVVGNIIFGDESGGGVLKLSDPTQLKGIIDDAAAGQSGAIIDFVNTKVTHFTLSGPPGFQSFQLVLTYGNNQTITYQGTAPNIDFDPNNVLLETDFHGGTVLTIFGMFPQSSVDVVGVQHQLEHPAV